MGEPSLTIGEMVVYPAQGVAKVVGIQEQTVAGSKVLCYVLNVVDTAMTIMVPVARAEDVGLRRLASEEDIQKVMEILKAPSPKKVDKQTWNRRYRGFMDKIKSGSLFEVAEVFRDLSRLKKTKVLSFGEKRMLDMARGLLLKELSIAQDKPEKDLEAELEKLIS